MGFTAGYVLFVIVAAVAYTILFNRKMDARLRPFWDRPDALAEWRHRFPARRVEEITAFLEALNEAFAFPCEHVYRFRPDDSLLAIHRALDPGEGLWAGAGGGEGWSFEILLRARLGLRLTSEELRASGLDRLDAIFERTGEGERAWAADDAPGR